MSKKKAPPRRRGPCENSWIKFLRGVKGQGLTSAQKKRLYRCREAGGANRPPTTFPLKATARPPGALSSYRPPPDGSRVMAVSPDCFLAHDMAPNDLCRFVRRVAPLRGLGFRIAGVVGSGSYGLVLNVIDARGAPHVMKVSRIRETRGDPVRFPVLNDQKTSWHTITSRDFERGVRSQQRLRRMMRGRVRIPEIVHAGRVETGTDEALGIVIMHRVPGATLRRVLGSAAVPARTKTLLVRKFASICAALHARGVIHGDFHTWNTICDPSGHLHLIDFDRASLSSRSTHRLHDLGMAIDTMAETHWGDFASAYFGAPNMSIPFVLCGETPADRKKELHEQSRDLFGVYLTHLREYEKMIELD